MAEKEIRWVKIAASIEEIIFQENNLAELEADGRKICLGKFQEELFAFAAKCPHASAPLSGGYIDAVGNVVCPLHRYKFCMRNGRNISGEGYFLKNWLVELRPEGVFIGFEMNSLFSLF